MKLFKQALLSGVTFVATINGAQAAEWRGTISSDWFTGGNWAAGMTPLAGEQILINAGSPNPVAFSTAGTVSVGQLFIGDGSLAITSGQLNTTEGFVGYYPAGGSVLVTGSTSKWINSGALIIGAIAAVPGNGKVTIVGGGQVTNTSGFIGRSQGSSGAMTVTDLGSSWINSEEIYVGFGGTGTLTVEKAGKVENKAGHIGGLAGSSGIATVTGTGSTWANDGGLTVGEGGAGTLLVEDEGAVTSTSGYIGSFAHSVGQVSVLGAKSSWANTGNLVVGGEGEGSLSIQDGGSVTDANGRIGIFGDGYAMVEGKDSTWTNTLNLLVGESGTGALTVSAGGKVTNADGFIGYSADGGGGRVDITGADSLWANGGKLTVGYQSAGDLTIEHAGKVTDANATIGDLAGSSGKVTVTDTGSTWTTNDNLTVGYRGTGTLTVKDGGKVVSQYGGVAWYQAPGQPSTATISGAGSKWTVTKSLIVSGEGGTGMLIVEKGGSVSSQDGILGNVGTPGSLGTAMVTGAGSTWANSQDLAIGAAGAGRLTIADHGLVTVGANATVAEYAGSAGTLAIDQTGVLRITGDLSQNAGSTYVVGLGAAGLSGTGYIQTTGTATIAPGAKLQLTAGPQGYAAGRYTILTAGHIDGTYDFSAPISVFLTITADYDLTHAFLDVTQAAFTSVGLTPNQIATGGGAESLGAGNPLYDALLMLPTAATARDAFDQLSGEIHASARGMLLEDSRFIRDATNARIRAAFGDGSVAALPVMAYGEGGPELVAADTDRFAVWGQAFGSWANTGSDGNAAAFDHSTGGLLAGADTLAGGWRVGVLGGYSHSAFNVDDRNSAGSSDNYHLGLYGGTNWSALAFRTGAAYSWSSISTKRSVAFNGFADALSADYDAGTAQVFGELAYKANAGQFKLEPFANLAYVSVRTDGFTETGGEAALTSAATKTNATFTTLGLRGSTDLALSGIDATARGTLGWRHAFGDVMPTSTFAFAGGDAFTIAGVPIARDAAIVEVGFDFKLSANATLGLSYAGQFGGGVVDNGAKVDFGIKF